MRKLKCEPTREITNWQNAEAYKIPAFFEQKLCPKQTGSQTNTNFPNQFNRALSIDFGKVNPHFRNFLKNIDQSTNSKSLTLVLGLTDGKFNVFFKTSDTEKPEGSQVNYYTIDGVLADAISYDITPAPVRFVKRRVGITTKLQNQFVYNWQIADLSVIPDLFYRRVIPKPTNSNVLNGAVAAIAFPRYNGLVRAHAYVIPKDDLISLSLAVQKNSHFIVHFGLNPANEAVNKDRFTLIIETKRKYPRAKGFKINNVRVKGTPDGSSGGGSFKSTASLRLTGKVRYTNKCGEKTKRSLVVRMSELGVSIKLGTSKKFFSCFNEEIVIPFKKKNDFFPGIKGRMIVWVSPQFVNVQIEEDGKSPCDSKKKKARKAKLFHLDYGFGVASKNRVHVAPASFGTGSMDDFVQTRPPH